MAVKEEKILQEAEKSLREAGYTVTKGMTINFSLVEDTSGGKCTGGCALGCYTCSPGRSEPKIMSMHPTFQVLTPDILGDLVSITKTQKPVEEKSEK
ncbi:MAG: hypothetical protein KAJ00_03800 [Deltaproteobacteria bacterium]|nr:hypothetical protein [Deltaproteobacteria bacterium]